MADEFYSDHDYEQNEVRRKLALNERRLMQNAARLQKGGFSLEDPPPPAQPESSSLWGDVGRFALAKGARFLKGVVEPSASILQHHPLYGPYLKPTMKIVENEVRKLEQADPVSMGQPVSESGLVTQGEWNATPGAQYETPFTSKMAQGAGQWVGTPIPFLRAPGRIPQAIRNIAPVAGLSGVLETAHQLELPKEQRKWSEVPKSAAAGGVVGAAFGGLMPPLKTVRPNVEPFLTPQIETKPPQQPIYAGAPSDLPAPIVGPFRDRGPFPGATDAQFRDVPRLPGYVQRNLPPSTTPMLPPPPIPRAAPQGQILSPQAQMRQLPRVIEAGPPKVAPETQVGLQFDEPRLLEHGGGVQAEIVPPTHESVPNPAIPELPVAPARFEGTQSGFGVTKDFDLYTVDRDLPPSPGMPEGIVRGSTVSGHTLEQAGFRLPPREPGATPFAEGSGPAPATPAAGELFPGHETMQVGTRPIIGREATPQEAPLFSRDRGPQPEQGALPMAGVDEELQRRANLALAQLEGYSAEPGGFRNFHEAQLGGAPDVQGFKSTAPEWYKSLTGPTPKGFQGTRVTRQQVDDVLGELAAGKVPTSRQQQVVDLIQDAIRRDRGIGKDLEAYRRYDHTPRPDELPHGSNPIENMVEETARTEQGLFEDLKDIGKYLLSDERGSITLEMGNGMGPLAKYFLNGRRVAELHPEYKPIYERFQAWKDAESRLSFDLLNKLKPYAELPKEQKAIVDELLRARRRGRGINQTKLTTEQAMAIKAHDDTMKASVGMVNQARATQGLPPIDPMTFYTPFMRSGDYLVIREATPSTARVVMAFPTFKSAKQALHALDAQNPAAAHRLQIGTGDLQPTVDFGTLHALEQVGILDQEGLKRAVEKFGLPPGFAAHFRQAKNVLGEEPSLQEPLKRYISGVSQYAAKLEHAPVVQDLINKTPRSAAYVKDYATKQLRYVQEHPQEMSNVRAAVATYDLGLNFAAMVQNATAMPMVGLPRMMEQFGNGPGVKFAAQSPKLLRQAKANPQSELGRVLGMAMREGVTNPVNAMELWGHHSYEPSTVEFGGRTLGRIQERAMQPGASPFMQGAGRMAEKLENPIDKAAGLWRGTSDTFEEARPLLMAGYSHIEQMNRELAVVSAYSAARAEGKTVAQAYALAKEMSNNINFDYSRFSRPPAFQGWRAPFGLFATFQQEYLSTASHEMGTMFRGLAKNDVGKALPLAALMGAYWSAAGVKGMPFVQDINERTGGKLRQSMPELAWRGPVNALTGLDVSSKFGMRIPMPVDLGKGEIDLHNVPITSPIANTADALDLWKKGPKDAVTAQYALERVLPPGLKNPAQALRWAGAGPAGKLDHGTVGTPRGHTPGPTDANKSEFFQPTKKDIALKFAGFNPDVLAKQQERRVEQGVLDTKMKEYKTATTNEAARDIQKQGIQFELNRENSALRRLKKESPDSYRELMKAYQAWTSAGRRGSVQQFYRKAQEPPVINPDLTKIPRKPSDYRKPGYSKEAISAR